MYSLHLRSLYYCMTDTIYDFISNTLFIYLRRNYLRRDFLLHPSANLEFGPHPANQHLSVVPKHDWKCVLQVWRLPTAVEWVSCMHMGTVPADCFSEETPMTVGGLEPMPGHLMVAQRVGLQILKHVVVIIIPVSSWCGFEFQLRHWCLLLKHERVSREPVVWLVCYQPHPSSFLSSPSPSYSPRLVCFGLSVFHSLTDCSCCKT